MARTYCPQYTIRLDATTFLPSKKQRQVMNRWNRFLSTGTIVNMLEQWQCPQHRMRAVRRRNYAAHLRLYRGILEQLEQVEIDAFPTAFVTD
jgi:hypothetical protein